MESLDITEVARRAGVPASTLRFYEEKGLIASIGRRGLHRLFGASVLERLGHENVVTYLQSGQAVFTAGTDDEATLAAAIGLNVTLSSYRDHMDFGFVSNAAAIDDARALAEHTRQAYADLKAAAKETAS